MGREDVTRTTPSSGETRVLSSTTVLPRDPLPQGVKVYEDETKVVHAVDGIAENGIQPLSSSEVDELIHKADEVTLSEAGSTAGPAEPRGLAEDVTMVFMGYQNVEDEAETKKVLGLQDTIKAELVVIEDAATPREPAPLNGSAAELPATKEENQTGPTTTPSDTQDLDMKKPRCRCCSVM